MFNLQKMQTITSANHNNFLSFDSEMQMITNHNKSRYFSVQLGIFSLKVFCGGWVVGGGLQVTLVFCFGPKHNNCSLDLNLDQAEQ